VFVRTNRRAIAMKSRHAL